MELEFIFIMVIALYQVAVGAPPVEVSQSKMTVLERQTVTAVCRVGRPISYCRFFIPQIGGYNLSPSIPPSNGIEYHGSGLDRGECGIRISSVKKEHNGLITCHLGYPTESQESTGKIQLVVAQPPSTPKLNIRRGVHGLFYEEGEKIQADCRVEGGRPVANISWFLGSDPITDGLSSPSYENGTDDLQTVSQSLTLPVKYTDHGKDLRCVANHIALGPSNINHSIHRLNINFPPKPKSSETEQFGFTIGQPGKIVVMFNANPKPNIHWEVGNERLTEGMKDSSRSFEAHVLINKGPGTWAAVLYIAKVTAKDVEKKYTLVAENDLGREAYKVAISTSPAPPADITAGVIAGIVVAVLVILLIISILIFARAFGKWCFAGSKPRHTTGESKYAIPDVGSLTYKNYKPIETEDGKKIYVSPEDEKKILLASQIHGWGGITFENKIIRKRQDSDSSDIMYEIPKKSKSGPNMPGNFGENELGFKDGGVSLNPGRHSLPFYGRKRCLFPEDQTEAKFVEITEDILNLPPHMQQIGVNKEDSEVKFSSVRNKFSRWFTKNKKIEDDVDESANREIEATSDPSNEQIPVKVNIEDSVRRNGEKELVQQEKDFNISLKSNAKDRSDKKLKRNHGGMVGGGKNEYMNNKDKSKITLKTILGIENVPKKPKKEEPFLEMEQKEEREMEDKILTVNEVLHNDQEKVTEFKTIRESKCLEDSTELIRFPTNIPLRGRWGPKGRKMKAISAPEVSGPDERLVDKKATQGILSPPWKNNKKGRPISFAEDPVVFGVRSDTESADHGSADKSSVSKLTDEKQQKKFLGQLLYTIKGKNKDKVSDNEALRNLPMTIDKDVEQQTQNDNIQKNHIKTDGIVYAELDIARTPGSVVIRDDDKTEYAEIIHPKQVDLKRSKDELRKSRESLSGSRELLTKEDGMALTPSGKKEAAV